MRAEGEATTGPGATRPKGIGEIDAPDGHELDGVRVLRTLLLMQALKAQLRAEPENICRAYQQR